MTLASNVGLSEPDIRSAMSRFVPKALSCVSGASHFDGTVETELTVGCDGRVTAVSIEHNDGVDTVTLNRPDSLNALDAALIDALNAYFQGLQRNRDTRVVVLKGAGKNYCAGLDLKAAMARRAGQQEPPGVTESLDSQRRIADIVMLMRRCPQPIISLVQGAAAGGGFALALASDIRIATKSARMRSARRSAPPISSGPKGCCRTPSPPTSAPRSASGVPRTSCRRIRSRRFATAATSNASRPSAARAPPACRRTREV